MTTIGKIFAVFITVSSVIYMAFGLMLWTSPTPDWRVMANEVPGYTFNHSSGDTPTWTATNVRSGEAITNAVLPSVLESSYKKLLADLDASTKVLVNSASVDMVARTAKLNAEYETYDKEVAIDIAALEKRQKEVLAELAALHVNIEKASQEGNVKTNESQKIRTLSSLRREDVRRLTAELDEVYVDLKRIEDQQNQLKDLIIRIEGAIIRLENRNQLLKSQSTDGTVPK